MKDKGYDIIDENELVEDTSIDRHNLDLHWENQAAIHNKWSRRLRQAVRLQNKYSTDYRLLKSELFRRGRAGEYDLEGSMTDTALKNWIEGHSEYRKALRKRNKYDAIVHMLQGIIFTINQRRDLLEHETKLLLGGIYAEPRIPIKAKEVSEENTQAAQRKSLNKKMKKRKGGN